MREIQVKVTYNQTSEFHSALLRREFRIAYTQWMNDYAIFNVECQDTDEIESLEQLKKEFKIIE